MTSTRPGAPAPSRRRETLLVAGLTALMTAAVLALVGLLAGPAAGPVEPGMVQVAGGQVSLATIRPEVMSHPEDMPASMMPDPIPAGYARYAIEVTLTADDDEPLAYSASQIRVAAGDEPPVGPVRQSLGDGVVPPGSSLTTSLVYEVPEDARRATLLIDGREMPFLLPAGAGHHTPSSGDDTGNETGDRPRNPVVVGGADVEGHHGATEEP